jgi:hypothetical protein
MQELEYIREDKDCAPEERQAASKNHVKYALNEGKRAQKKQSRRKC